jgi:hypothetical protein
MTKAQPISVGPTHKKYVIDFTGNQFMVSPLIRHWGKALAASTDENKQICGISHFVLSFYSAARGLA